MVWAIDSIGGVNVCQLLGHQNLTMLALRPQVMINALIMVPRAPLGHMKHMQVLRSLPYDTAVSPRPLYSLLRHIIYWLRTLDHSLSLIARTLVTARGGSRKVASGTWLADGPSADGAVR